MRQTTIFEDIGFGMFGKSEIKVVEDYTPSNDYECTTVTVDGTVYRPSNSTYDALKWALDEETATWIIHRM